VARWKDSGLSAAAFAAQIGVNPHTLTWWKRQLASKAVSDSAKRTLACRPAGPTPERTTSSPLTFVELTAALETDALEVVLASSVRIRVRRDFDGPTLGRLLDVLERRS
jgi:transposase-like protein